MERNNDIMIMLKRSELTELLHNAVATGIKQCIDEGIVIGITSKYKQKLKSVKNAQKYYTPKQLCERWDISLSTLWSYEKRGLIKAIRHEGSRKVFFDKEQIDNMDSPRYKHADLQNGVYGDSIIFDIDPQYT